MRMKTMMGWAGLTLALAQGALAQGAKTGGGASDFSGLNKKVTQVNKALSSGDAVKAADGLIDIFDRGVKNGGGSSAGRTAVSVRQQDPTWGGPTGKPPELPKFPKPERSPRREPERRDPPQREPARREPARRDPAPTQPRRDPPAKPRREPPPPSTPQKPGPGKKPA